MHSGIVTQAAAYGVKQTMDTLQALIERNGGTIYARIDQQAELKKAGIAIRPLEFILFGNPAQGGRLIQENPVTALDLPLKIIVWENEQQQVRLAYNGPGYLEERYGLPAGGHPALDLRKLVGDVIKDSPHL